MDTNVVKINYQPLILVGAGIKPTIPTNLNDVPGSSTWKITDILIGQHAFNVTDNAFYYRSANGIDALDESILYSNAKQMPEKVGGYLRGSSFDKVRYTKLMDGLLYPYQTPEFADFDISINGKNIDYYTCEVGTHFDLTLLLDYAVDNYSSVASTTDYVISSNVLDILNETWPAKEYGEFNINVMEKDLNSIETVRFYIKGYSTKGIQFEGSTAFNVRNYYYSYVGAEGTSPITSTAIRQLQKAFLDDKDSGQFTLAVPAHTSEISIYTPGTKSIKVIDVENLGANLSDNFTIDTVDITYTNGTHTSYKKYTIYLGTQGYGTSTEFNITIY